MKKKKNKKIERKLVFKGTNTKIEGCEKAKKNLEPILGKTDRYLISSPSPYHFMSRINVGPKRKKKKY